MAGKAHPSKKFEPRCRWEHGEDRDILEIELQGFKKEQLRIKLINSGTLEISGERLDSSEKLEFHKKVDLTRNTYINNAIHAKFQYGRLYITMPKSDQTPKLKLPKDQSTMVPPPPPPSHDRISGGAKEKTPEQELPKDQSTLAPPLALASEDSTRGGAKDQTLKQEVPEDQSILGPPPPPFSHGSINGAKVHQMPPSRRNTLPEFEFHGHNPLMPGLRVGEMAVNLAATAAAIVVLVAYVVYMYKSTFDGV
ncbi:hypothetical protein OROGR_018609 [Orobanche gracilis]